MHDLDFLAKKRVLITGHTGFKGSWLSRILVTAGAEVFGYALEPEKNSLFSALQLEKDMDSKIADIRDEEKLKNFIKLSKPEIVIHLAAQALVRDSYEDPITTYTTNVIGSLNLLNSVSGNDSIRSLVFITSDKCYENFEWPWGYRETDQLGGHDPYSASKACAELLFSSFCRSFWSERKAFSASARAGNVIGGGDYSKDRIIPDCIRAAMNSDTVFLRNPKSTRPWQHVLEPLSGYIALSRSLFNGEINEIPSSWNFGPDIQKEITTMEVAKSVLHTLGSGDLKFDESSQPHEAGLLQLNCDKAKIQLGWQPKWDSIKSINKTSVWYKSVMDGESAKEVTDNQIQEYFNE